MKRSPLARKTPLRRSGPIKPTRTHGTKAVPPSVYLAVVRRDGECVGRRLVPEVACFGRLDPHHVLRRSQGGLDTPENLILLCRSCHDWVHAHPALSVERGLLRRSGL